MRNLLFLAVLSMPALVAGDVFTIDWHTFDGGGASFTSTTDGTVAVAGTIGQPDASAALTGGTFELTGGFWTNIALNGNGTWIVTNTNDSGDGSLRDILSKVSHGDTVLFGAVFDAGGTTSTIPNKDALIADAVPLPPLDKGFVTINAQEKSPTLNGAVTVGNETKIISSGLRITTVGNVVRGLSIVRFGDGIILEGNARQNVLGGNRATGAGDNGQGLRVSGNLNSGIKIRGANTTGNTIKGCWIGLDASGDEVQGNNDGIFISQGAKGNTIGSAEDGEENVISGNDAEGITIADPATDDTVIIGNVIGLGPIPSGASRRSLDSRALDDIFLPTRFNNGRGIFVQRGSKRTRIGSKGGSGLSRAVFFAEGNIIGRNAKSGITIEDSDSTGNTSRGNRVGKNGKGIILSAGGNANITPPTRAASRAIEKMTDNADGTVKIKVRGTVPKTGGVVEVFSDPDIQGSVLLGSFAVASTDFELEVDAIPSRNVNATFTDVEGNTSPYASLGLPPGSEGTGGDTLNDTDGDGVPNAIEELLGSSPSDANSLPSGFVGTATPETLQVNTLSVKVAFTKKDPTKPKDSISLSGAFPLSDGFLFTPQDVILSVGGVIRTFQIDAKGSAKTLAKDSLKLGKPKKGISKLTAKIGNDDFVEELQDEGITSDPSTKGNRPVSAVMYFNGKIYQGTKTLLYTAKADKKTLTAKMGSAK